MVKTILEEATFEAFGYYQSTFKLRSAKLIISACTLCGEIRICTKAAYTSFCPECRKIFKCLSKEALKKGKQEKRILLLKQKRETEWTLKNKKKQQKREKKRNEDEEREREKREDRKILWIFRKNRHGEYCDLFNKEYKYKIRERYGKSCFLCGMWEIDNGKALSVHHVNYDPSCGCDGAKCVCVPLCQSCHAKTNHKREYWRKKIISLLRE